MIRRENTLWLDRQLWVVGVTFLGMLGSLWRAPHPNEQWLQHIPTVCMLAGLAWSSGRVRLAPFSFACAITFVWLHIIGARWIYSMVPYDAVLSDWFGIRLADVFGWQRNHYDRLVHLASGVLGVPVAIDWLRRSTGNGPGIPFSRGLFRCLAWSVIMAIGAAYEVLEWQIAMLFSPEHAEAYNGQQGDMWDAQKDLCLAGLGGLIAMTFPWAWMRPPNGFRGGPDNTAS